MTYTDETLSIRYYGTVVCQGVARGIWAIAPVVKDLKDAGNRVVSILGADAETDLLWEQAIRVVSDKVVVSALDGSRGEPLHVDHPLFQWLNRGDVDLVVAAGPQEEIKRLELIVKAQGRAFVALPAEH